MAASFHLVVESLYCGVLTIEDWSYVTLQSSSGITPSSLLRSNSQKRILVVVFILGPIRTEAITQTAKKQTKKTFCWERDVTDGF